MALKKEAISGLFLLLFIMMIASTKNCMAFPVSSIRWVMSQSDLICKGKVVRIDKIGELEKKYSDGTVAKINVKVAQVEVDRVLKGNGIGKIVEVEFQEELGYEFLQQGEYLLLFLKEEEGRYIFTNPHRGKIDISSKKLQVGVVGTTPIALLEQELLNSLTDENSKMVLSSLEVLGELLSPLEESNKLKSKAAPWVEKLLSSTNPVIRGRALAILLRLGNYSHIDEAVRYLDEEKPTPKVRMNKRAICFAFGTIRNPSVVPKLHPLLKHKNDLLRGNVAESLRNIQSKSSIPYFIAGLDDKDEGVRYHCMMGLSKMFEKGGDWAPAYKRFLKNESKHISLWKDWWEKEGKDKFLQR